MEKKTENEIKEFVVNRLIKNFGRPSAKAQLLELITIDEKKGEIHTDIKINEITCLHSITEVMRIAKMTDCMNDIKKDEE